MLIRVRFMISLLVITPAAVRRALLSLRGGILVSADLVDIFPLVWCADLVMQ